MYSYTLPLRTQIIGGRTRSGKSTTARLLASSLIVNSYPNKTLFVTDNLEDFLEIFKDRNLDNIDVIKPSYPHELNVTMYNTVILDMACYFTDIDKMQLDFYNELSPSILRYLKSIGDQLQIPFVVLTAFLSKNSMDLIKPWKPTLVSGVVE